MTLLDHLKRFEQERNGCEGLLAQAKLVDRFFHDSEMNELSMLTRFFEFLNRAMAKYKQSAAKLVIKLPGSNLLKFAYSHFQSSPARESLNGALETFAVVFTRVLLLLLEIHPFCYSQLDSMGLFDRLDLLQQRSQVGSDILTSDATWHTKIFVVRSRIRMSNRA